VAVVPQWWFPLILTFSRREKEQPLFHFLKRASIQAAFSGGLARVLGAFLPRPAGEGRGEGEARSSNLDFENTP